MKKTGTLSHLLAQKEALVKWLTHCTIDHAILTRVVDDTYALISPHERPDKFDAATEEPVGRTMGKLGRRKVAPLLGIVQRLSIRPHEIAETFAGSDGLQTAQVHVPSQVLPKANFGQFGYLIWFKFKTQNSHCFVL